MARRKIAVKPSVNRSPLEDFTRTIDEDDHEYLEELLGYNSWDDYGCIGTADGGSLTDEDDASSFAPWGGVICPSQRFFGHHEGLRREIEDHTEDDKEDDRGKRADELDDETKDWFRRNGEAGRSRKGYRKPYIYGAKDVGDKVGPLQVPEWFAASESLRIQRIIQEDQYRAVRRTQEETRRFIEEMRSEVGLTKDEEDKPLRMIIGDPLVDTLEWDSARKADSIRKKLMEDFDKDFFGEGTDKERQR